MWVRGNFVPFTVSVPVTVPSLGTPAGRAGVRVCFPGVAARSGRAATPQINRARNAECDRREDDIGEAPRDADYLTAKSRPPVIPPAGLCRQQPRCDRCAQPEDRLRLAVGGDLDGGNEAVVAFFDRDSRRARYSMDQRSTAPREV